MNGRLYCGPTHMSLSAYDGTGSRVTHRAEVSVVAHGTPSVSAFSANVLFSFKYWITSGPGPLAFSFLRRITLLDHTI